jgi:hypothetical protein
MGRGTRPKRERPAPDPATATPVSAHGEGAALLVLCVLGALAAARALLAFLPGTAFWGMNLMRFAPAIPAWTLWAAGVLVLVPGVASRVEGALPRAARSAEGTGWAAALWVAGAAALAFALPDRTLFVGDSILRQNALHAPSDFAALNPQALLPDRWLHDDLPRLLAARTGWEPLTVTRFMGALEAAAMAWLALHAARVLGTKGTRGWAVASLVLFTGAFGLFTGYSKSLSELSLLVAAAGVFGVEYLRTGRGLAPLGLACAAGVAVHRLGLGMLPAFAIALALRPPALSGATARERAGFAFACLAPVVSLALVGPALVRIVAEFDPQNFRGAGGGAGNALAAALSPRRLLDSAEMVMCVGPLAPLAASALVPSLPPAMRRERMFVLALPLPWLLLLPFFQPSIGIVRNWDVFAPLGVSLALACAWGLSAIPHAGRFGRTLGLAVAVNAFVPAAVALLHHADVASGLARVEALLAESPPRGVSERASAWDFLGYRYVDLGRLDASAHAFSQAAELTPSPRILRQWAVLEEMRGRPLEAREVLRRLVARKPDEVRAWAALVRLSYALGDTAGARRTAAAAEAAVPALRSTPPVR